ncbi:hypothetical protein ACFWPH_04750 [Nocardia sp. NPDC058499]|uniref:hypothetical protein n=1 Tax=Nocardia sp. NPDC058499 TaxID=3346530 RepID=UPI003650C096
MFRTKRTFATRRVVIAGAIALLPLAAVAAPAAADPAAPGYTQVDRDHHRDRDRHWDRDRDRDRHWDRDRDHHRDRDRHWDRGHQHGWDDPADWFRHILRGAFGSS